MLNLNLNVNGSTVEQGIVYEVLATIEGKLPPDLPLFSAKILYVAGFGALPETPSEDELHAFGTVSVAPMVYPYVREVLAGLTGRAGLPAVTLPPYRVSLQ